MRLALTARAGGVSAPPYDELNLGGHVGDDPAAVRSNRRLVAAAAGVPPERLLFAEQVHGTDVAVVDGPWLSPRDVPAADALVTATPGLAVGVLVADCTPVLLASTDPPVVGVAHAGRRGMAAGVVLETISVMRGLGADPSAMVAVVGAGICGRCYEVPAKLQAEVAVRAPQSRSTTRQGTPAVDVHAGVTAQLRAAGVPDISVDSACTRESSGLFSHRRDGVTGRFAGVAWIV